MATTTKKKKLTKAEIRIAIAEDVIAQIKSNKYKPTQGSWVEVASGEPYEDWLYYNAQDCKVDVRDYTKNIKKCHVCALGSLFVSAVNKYNNVYGTYDSLSFEQVFHTIAIGKKTSPLLRYFSISQLQLIEFTFENGMGYNYNLGDEVVERKALEFYKQYPNMKDLLLAIMKNIIKNKGTFKP